MWMNLSSPRRSQQQLVDLPRRLCDSVVEPLRNLQTPIAPLQFPNPSPAT
ncbi:hypothetical protein JOB18_021570 [Solea senegalensis]|uniref:Uncharacterized protein n=1 Tax=Solea senegalensis TaxID=28829 RepID=A0AAV6RYZ2_SOLSE|nr:hypothetical protein JOB18_021570 [Solea senegalensis]